MAINSSRVAALRGGARVVPPTITPTLPPPATPFFGRNRDGSSALDRAAQGTKEELPIPDWIKRTAPSKTPGGPWVTHYRIWVPGIYEGEGIVSEPRLDLRFKDGHEHAYAVPHQVITAAKNDPTGGFVHRVLLGKGWNNKNRQSRYRNWPI